MSSPKLSHLDEQGRARMVDVGHKPDTERVAIAKGEVHMRPETLALIQTGNLKKGDLTTVAELAGVMAAKRTSELIPLCHPLSLNHVSVEPRLVSFSKFIHPAGNINRMNIHIRYPKQLKHIVQIA